MSDSDSVIRGRDKDGGQVLSEEEKLKEMGIHEITRRCEGRICVLERWGLEKSRESALIYRC
ncbi:hypothetical protein KEM48_009808, partial [Puccinia striiformis f. sp. tritici PST-130]